MTAFFPEYWSRRQQAVLRKTLVMRDVVSMAEQATLSNGDVVHRPYRGSNALSANDYTRGTDVTPQDVTPTDESLTVNVEKEVTTYLDLLDKKQSAYGFDRYIDDAAYVLRNSVDGDTLDEIASAFSTVDDGDIGGTAGTAITLSTSNVINTFSTAQEKLLNNNVEMDRPWYAVISPRVANTIQQSAIASGFNLADTTFKNGYAGAFLNWKIKVSNNVRHTASFNIATNPSEGDTVVINGVTFTFNATPSGAGSVDIGGTAAASVDNLVLAINNGAVGSTYIQLSTPDRNKLKNDRVVATDGTTTLDLTSSGQMTLSETFTDTTDNVGAQTAHNYLARQGATDLVMQIAPTVQKNKAPLQTGDNFLSYMLYGIKTFDEGTDRMIDLQTIASAASASV